MAETDPRKIRPSGQNASRREIDSEDDPLVELARIVSEDSGFPASRTDKAKQQRGERMDRNALSADLEAELLQELESSFAPRNPVGSSSPKPAGQRPAPEPIPADDADDLLRSIEAQLGEFERRTQAAPPVRADRSDPRAASRAEPEPASDWNDDAPPAARDERDTASELQPARSLRRIEEPPATSVSEETALPTPRERASGVRPTAWRDRPENTAENRTAARASRRPAQEPETLPSSEETPTPAQERQVIRSPLRRRDTPRVREGLRELPARTSLAGGAVAGWSEISAEDDAAAPQSWRDAEPDDYRRDLRPTISESDDIQEAPAPSAREPAAELEPRFSDPTLDTEWIEAGSGGAAFEPRVSPAGRLNDTGRGGRAGQRQGSRGRWLAAAAVLGVLVLGGAVLALLPGDEAPSGPPPVIAAPAGDVKVEPPRTEEQAQTETVGEAVYNRVAGDAAPVEEQVVDGAEEPREISRVVLPAPQTEAGEGLDPDGGDRTGPVANESVAASDDLVIGPRRVKTFVVRPDGTITAATEPPPPSASSSPPQPAAAASTPIEPVPVSTTSINAAGEATGQPSPPTLPGDVSGSGPPSDVAEPEVAADTPAGAAPDADIAAVEPAPQAPAEVAAVAPAVEQPAPVARRPAVSDDAPVDLLSAAPAQETSAPDTAAPAGEGYRVQVSSQRSMADAQSSLASMQRRFPGIIGSLPADIQEADLGAKGIYYRVRVGSWATRAEAIGMCEALQGAGGSCFVTR